MLSIAATSPMASVTSWSRSEGDPSLDATAAVSEGVCATTASLAISVDADFCTSTTTGAEGSATGSALDAAAGGASG